MSLSPSSSPPPSPTPPSSPELHFDPPSILLRSALVREAYLSLHADEGESAPTSTSPSIASSLSPPPALPSTVYPGGPTDAECGLPSLLTVALSAIDASSLPLVTFLRRAPALCVLPPLPRRRLAQALAHLLNVRRSSGGAAAALLVARTDRIAKEWRDALIPALDDTLDISVHLFLCAKAPREHALRDLANVRCPGLVIASEKGLRTPAADPGMARLSQALAQNPHSIRWDIAVSDAVRPSGANDDVSPMRMLADRQTAQSVVVTCKEDLKAGKERLEKTHVAAFVAQHMRRFADRDRDVETMWCTPEILKACVAEGDGRGREQKKKEERVMRDSDGENDVPSGRTVNRSKERKQKRRVVAEEDDDDEDESEADWFAPEMQKKESIVGRKEVEQPTRVLREWEDNGRNGPHARRESEKPWSISRTQQVKVEWNLGVKGFRLDPEMEMELEKLRLSAFAQKTDTKLLRSKEEKVERKQQMHRDAWPKTTALEPEMEVELERLRNSASMQKTDMTIRKSADKKDEGKASGNGERTALQVENAGLQRLKDTKTFLTDKGRQPLRSEGSSEQTPLENKLSLPAMDRKGLDRSRGRPAPSKNVSKRGHRTVIHGYILPQQSTNISFSVLERRRQARTSASGRAVEDDIIIVADGSDGEEFFFDAEPWLPSPPKKIRTGSREGAGEERIVPSPRPSGGQRLPSSSSSTTPSVHVKDRTSAHEKAGSEFGEERCSVEYGEGKSTLQGQAQGTRSKARRRNSNGRRSSRRTSYLTGRHEVVENGGDPMSPSKSLGGRADDASGGRFLRKKQADFSGEDGDILQSWDRSRKQHRRKSHEVDGLEAWGSRSGGCSSSDGGRRRPGRNASEVDQYEYYGSGSKQADKKIEGRAMRTSVGLGAVEVLESVCPIEESSRHANIDKNKVWVTSSDDDMEPSRRMQSSGDKNGGKNGTKPSDGRGRRIKGESSESEIEVLAYPGVKKLQPDMKGVCREDRRRYNSLISQADAYLCMGPERAREAHALYCKALDIFDGDDYLTNRILAFCSMENVFDEVQSRMGRGDGGAGSSRRNSAKKRRAVSRRLFGRPSGGEVIVIDD